MIKFHWRPLIPGERDEEFLWGAILGISGLIAVAWFWSGLPTPLCPFHAITGIPCPTCGMTRGLHCLLRGDPATAFLFNPLGMIVLIGLVLYLLYTVIVVTARLPRLRWECLSNKKILILRLGVVSVIAINWIYLIYNKQFINVLN